MKIILGFLASQVRPPQKKALFRRNEIVKWQQHYFTELWSK